MPHEGPKRVPPARAEALARRLEDCMLADRARLRARLRRLGPRPAAAALTRLAAEIETAVARRARRAATGPRVDYPADLPVVARREDIACAIRDHPVVIVCGETGSGKSTQLPKICLELGRGVDGMIGHTQPRRLAARSLARRIAEELGDAEGRWVGHKVRFHDRTGPDTRIKLMTDGILLSEIGSDRRLLAYDTLIIDEAHERSLNIDFLLGYLKTLLPRRPELKLIVTSATIDPERFSRHFDGAPIIEVSGRSHPVEIRYRPPEDAEDELDLQQAIAAAVDELAAEGPGDILVFLPTERLIRETAEALRKHHPPRTEILPLYARLSAEAQMRVFAPHRGRRIVLATNVAETALTVPGIRYVVDTGTARVARYSPRAKVQRLPIEPISQASAAQRAGRCGRVAPGICIRLYSEEDFLARPRFTDPEIRRTNLAAVILRMAELGLGRVEDFPFVEPPEPRYVTDGYRLLQELGAVDAERRITPLGRRLARLPVDPRYARMLLAAAELGALREVLVLVAALEAQDPRERPLEAQEAADQAHRAFLDERSDFLALLKLWAWYQKTRRNHSRTQTRKRCRERFLSVMRLHEWTDIHKQLRAMVLEMGFAENTQPADYAALHQALLTGLLGHIAQLQDTGDYLGARGRRLRLWPGSGLARKRPQWIVAAELVETRRLYARTAARIEPEWVVRAAPHLVRREYLEPHWQPRGGRVGAFERLTLYGLTLVPRRRVNYGPIAQGEARALFIREGLVQGRWRQAPAFLQRNLAAVQAVRDEEARIRRRDLLVDEETLAAWYAARLPEEIHDGPGLLRALRRDRGLATRLRLREADLLRRPAGEARDRFPERLEMAGTRLALEYHFEPGAEADGVTLVIPVALLNQIEPQRLEWLIPGLLEEKLAALIRALPKADRRHFVPAPDFARAAREAIEFGEGDLYVHLSRALHRMTGHEIPAERWRALRLPDHLRMRLRVVDAQGRTLATGRDLQALRRQLAGQIAAHFRAAVAAPGPERVYTDWDFGPLDRPVTTTEGGVELRAWPAVVPAEGGVALRYMDTAQKAARASRAGIRRLLRLRLREPMRLLAKPLAPRQRICLLWKPLGECAALREDLVEAALEHAFLAGRPLPMDRAAFEARLAAGRAELGLASSTLAEQLRRILERHHAVRLRLQETTATAARQDIDSQLRYLVYPGFLVETPPERLARIPVYLQAALTRLDKLAQDPARDRRLAAQAAPWWQKARALLEQGRLDDPECVRFRWMVEEFRISLFDQRLGTDGPVSDQRLERQWRRCAPPAR